jgi:hypothetical protein
MHQIAEKEGVLGNRASGGADSRKLPILGLLKNLGIVTYALFLRDDGNSLDLR